ncbi:MAG: peptidoglycan DD-metalloendopeptidase family protein [Hyphomicrobiales bacterium]
MACSNDFSRVSDQDYTAAVSARQDFLRQPTRQPMPAVPMANGSSNIVARQDLQPVQSYPAQQAYPAQQTYAEVQPMVDYTRPAPSAQYRPTPANMASGAYQQSAPRTADPITTAAVGQDESGWTRNGGTTMTITPGETLYSISRRYNVPEQAILNANGLSGPRDIVAGRYLTIPTFVRAQAGQAPARNAQPRLQPFPQQVAQPAAQVAPRTTARAAVVDAVRSVGRAPKPSSKPVVQAAVSRPAAAPTRAATAGGSYRVASGDTLYSIARRHNVNIGTLSAANNLGQSTNIKIGQTLVIPGHGQTTTLAARQVPTQNISGNTQTAQLAPRNVQTTGSIQPPKPVAVQPVKQVQPVAYTPPKAEQQQAVKQPAAGSLSFRWPVRGRVISTFGDKTNGERNDGINLAVPDGTPVKAAEDGVVIYSGNELKSYGNLVLVRHSDGWVTAYAHNRALSVNRGDQVRRGQEIAQAGATGSVSSPQLRFELRKGSTPVNPLDHLGGV